MTHALMMEAKDKALQPPALGVPARVAVIGCGAMTRDFHLPVLAGHQGLKVAALVDRDVERARALARAYGVPEVFDDAAALDRKSIEAVLVVTPPFHHAGCTIDLVQRGFHVLVEKPMALTVADAEAMVRAADEAGVVLAVGHHRRMYESTRLLRSLIESEHLGRPLRFDIEEGGAYGWPLASLANLRKDQGGGGVLVDIGSHLIDLLLFCLPGDAEVLEYRDNARGGIETDCLARLRVRHRGHEVEGRVELSRTRELRNRLRIECERGQLELSNGDRCRVSIRPHGLQLDDPLDGEPRAFRLQAGWEDAIEAPGRQAYRAEMDAWLKAIQSGQPCLLDGRTAVGTVRVIEDCYRRVQPLIEPWAEVPASPRTANSPRRNRRVLLTGATGFIGCRVAEFLHEREGWQVRALIHNPGSAARLARLPVEMVVGDLQQPEELARAVRDCEAVVHCAVGPSWKSRREVFAVNAGGTRNLAEAALQAGVRRFVHLSTIAVYGDNVPSAVDEATPTNPERGGKYGESKLAAEQAILAAAARGLPAVILRPAHVYGPFGKTFVVNPLRRLARGQLVLVDPETTPSNTIHVDNVAEAIVRALEASESDVKGEIFLLGSEDDMTWAEFYSYFADALGKPLRTISAAEHARTMVRPSRWNPFGWSGACWRGCKEILTAPEFRSFARRCVQTDPFGRLPRWLIENSPRLRRLLKLDGPQIYRTAEQPPDDCDLTMRFLPARISIAKAQRVLGYQPALARERAMQTTMEWLRQARVLGACDV
jgi:predicted dehydrogenase/nucleoside-diphosphate-sugar epimerase